MAPKAAIAAARMSRLRIDAFVRSSVRPKPSYGQLTKPSIEVLAPSTPPSHLCGCYDSVEMVRAFIGPSRHEGIAIEIIRRDFAAILRHLAVAVIPNNLPT